MSEEDRRRWDLRYAELRTAADPDLEPPSAFAAFAENLPTTGFALEIACGRGEAALWLASRGMRVLGVDLSPVAIDLARERAARSGLAERCQFEVADLDLGLPDSAQVDL